MSDIARLVVLDVGHGNASVIQESGITVVVDTGLKGRLREFLEQQKIEEIECVVLSHSDADHISGLAGLLAGGLRINIVILNADADKTTEAWRDLIFALDGAHDRGEIDFKIGLSEGPLEISGFKNTILTIAAPTKLLAGLGVGAKNLDGRLITSNSLSAVVRVLYDNVPVALLTGDMDDVTLDEIIRKGTDIQARFLIFPHHGGLPGSANIEKFVRTLTTAVKPETVLFSHGREKHLNPSDIVVSEIINSLPEINIGCTQLSKRCAKNIPDAVRGFSPALFSAGEKAGICCAGTIVIPLADGIISSPNLTGYQEFVIRHVPNAICMKRHQRGPAASKIP